MTESPFVYCERIARQHYENFPVGWFLPRGIRKYVYTLYAFARTADDFADEEGYEGERLERLDEWQKKLLAASVGKADHPLFFALAELFEETSIPPNLLADLLQAFRWDVVKKRYGTFAELMEYCRYSANPIGRAVLTLFKLNDPERIEYSDKICTGIQLVNHWQDVAIDLKKGRVYLPEEDLDRFGYRFEDLEAERFDERFRALMRSEVDRARQFLLEGRPLLFLLPKRLKWQVELMWSGPMRILDRLEQVQFDVFRYRPTLRVIDLVACFFQNRFSGI